ncbi:MAG TPA: MFS transporter [Gaiellaceae bacterium]|nr:MFS transporter [Gaiellaceae bacterium]
MRRVHYAWIVALIGFVALITSAGFRSTSGALIVPLQNDFGWSRATIGLAVSINLIFYGLGGPFAAGLVERYGMRRVTIGALIGVGTGSSLTVFMHASWQLDLLWGVVNGLSTGAVSVPLAAMIANRWFVARRGLVTGVLTASNATGNLVFLPLLAWIIVHFGWRAAVLTVSVVAVAFVLPLVALFIRERPIDKGLAPFGAEELEPAPAPVGNPFANAVRGLQHARHDTSFWLLAGSFFICGLSTNGLIGTHLIPAAMDHGFGEVAAASLLATIGVFDIVGTTCSGWLTDRYDPRVLLAWYYGLRGLSLLALPYAFGSPHFGLILFVVFYGLDWVATVPPTIALTAEIFGRERVGVVFGWIFCAHMFGASFAAWGAGAIRTWFGGYGWAFGSAGLLCLFASGLVLQIQRGPSLRPAAVAA